MIPALPSLDDDTRTRAVAAMALFNDTAATVKALKSLGETYPGITGFNFDLEVAQSVYCGQGVTCSARYSQFLAEVKAGLLAETTKSAVSSVSSMAQSQSPPTAKWRVTADASCSKPNAGWAPVISNCKCYTKIVNAQRAGSYL